MRIPLIVAAALTSSALAQPMVTAVVTDSRLASVGGIVGDGTNLFTISAQPSNPFVRIFSVAVGGGSLTPLYSYNGTSTPGAVAPAGITLVGSNLYWMDGQSGPITDTQIFTAPKSGGGAVSTIYTGSGVGEPIVDGSSIATDGTKLYTADRVQGRIHSLNTNGTGITQLASRYGGFFDRAHKNTIAVRDGTVFIADAGVSGFPDTPPRIQSVSTVGGAVTTLFEGTIGSFQPEGIAVSDTTIFLSEGDRILQMPRSGGAPTVFATHPGFAGLGGLYLDGSTLYAADSGALTIWRITSVPEPSSLALLGLGGAALWRWRRSRVIVGSG